MIFLENINANIDKLANEKFDTLNIDISLHNAYFESIMENINLISTTEEVSFENIKSEVKKAEKAGKYLEQVGKETSNTDSIIKKTIKGIISTWDKLVTKIVGERIETIDVITLATIFLKVDNISENVAKEIGKTVLDENISELTKMDNAILTLTLAQWLKDTSNALEKHIKKLDEYNAKVEALLAVKKSVGAKILAGYHDEFFSKIQMSNMGKDLVTGYNKNLKPLIIKISSDVEKNVDAKAILKGDEYAKAQPILKEYVPKFIDNLKTIYDLRNKIAKNCIKGWNIVTKDVENQIKK